MKDSSNGANFIRMTSEGQKPSEYAISSLSDTPISINNDRYMLKKIFRKFSKCRARMTYSWGKNKKVFKYRFYRDNFANWTILDHFQKIFLRQNFLDHSLNFETHFCDFSHF